MLAMATDGYSWQVFQQETHGKGLLPRFLEPKGQRSFVLWKGCRHFHVLTLPSAFIQQMEPAIQTLARGRRERGWGVKRRRGEGGGHHEQCSWMCVPRNQPLSLTRISLQKQNLALWGHYLIWSHKVSYWKGHATNHLVSVEWRWRKLFPESPLATQPPSRIDQIATQFLSTTETTNPYTRKVHAMDWATYPNWVG